MTPSEQSVTAGEIRAQDRAQRVSELTATQLRSSALGWHEIADMVEEGASDEEIATVARATYFRDQYGV